jgi:hypothetical protein
VLAAKLDGEVATRSEQLALAGRYLAVNREGYEAAMKNVFEVMRGRT